MQFIIPSPGVSGLVGADFDFRFYSDIDPAPLPVEFSVTETAEGDYLVSGLPESLLSTVYTLTWDLDGQSGAKIYGGLGSPSHVIIPSREAGLLLADFSPAIYVDGALATTVTLSAVELSAPGDYAISGWPILHASSEWLLIWRRADISYSYAWVESPLDTSSGPTRFLEIISAHEPASIGLDSSNRALFTCNFDSIAAYPVDRVELCVATILEDAGLGSINADIFIGPSASIPDDVGPYISIINTGGVAPIETHDSIKYQRPSIQTIIRATDYTASLACATQVWRTLDGLRNITVNPPA